ncbi:MAG: hypothetical protein DLM54_04290 [Acidimicrobiales bacterium]|nr:MAG: hypothetical protein DLM54_04290 [Acidimicrobiales bacterium]
MMIRPASPPQIVRVAGIDGCSYGWVALVFDATPNSTPGLCTLSFIAGQCHPTLRGALNWLNNQQVVLTAVDMPIGLPSAQRASMSRQCDTDARKYLNQYIKGRGSSVFPCPTVKALGQVSPKMSKQTSAILPKVKQVNTSAIVKSVTVIEAHPEVSFVHLAIACGQNPQAALGHPKRKVSGRNQRAALLQVVAQNQVLSTVAALRYPIRSRVKVDDVLDAWVSAWTAYRAVIGCAGVYGQAGPRPGFTQRCIIWA